MLCTVINGPSYREALEQISKCKDKAEILEFRLDCFNFLSFDSIQSLMKETSLPIILTLRPKRHDGNFALDERARLDLINNFACLNPAYIDIEHDVQEVPKGCKIIRSYHNFQETPSVIPTDFEGDIVKVVTFANTSCDALRMLSAVKSHPNIIGLCMGEKGKVSRILSPIVQNCWTYSSIDEESSIGQLTIDDHLSTYHYKSLNPQSRIYGLIGKPVTQSLSHKTHNALMNELGLNSVYVKMEVEPSELPEFLKLAKKMEFRGLSVTMPLKEAIIPYLDELDPVAYQIGAVNTLVFSDQMIKGYNTDCIGALNAIERRTLVKGKSMLILGAGGAARAIAYEAKKRGAEVFVFNRNFEKAQKFADQFKCQSVPKIKEDYDILINCTPSPMPIDLGDINPSSLVMDININQEKFLKTARKRGCSIINGHEMFALQAIEQFKIWFGEENNYEKQFF